MKDLKGAHNVYTGYLAAKHNILCFAPAHDPGDESLAEKIVGTVALAGVFVLLALV